MIYTVGIHNKKWVYLQSTLTWGRGVDNAFLQWGLSDFAIYCSFIFILGALADKQGLSVQNYASVFAIFCAILEKLKDDE